MSRRLAVLNFLIRTFGKPRLTRITDPADMRRDFARLARFVFRRPAGMRLREEAGNPSMTWVSCGPIRPDRVVLYFHGGGFVVGSPNTHAGMVARLSQLSGLRIAAPRYRLAPEHPFPAAFDDARRAWELLRDKGYAPEKIALGGDSAGGTLALSLLADLCRDGTPPAALFAFSPFTDMTGSGASTAENAARDPILPGERLQELVGMVVGDHQADDPRASPLFADFPNCPPVLLQVSRSEILRDDTLRMADHLKTQGASVEVELWDDAVHVWQLFDGWIPEAREALASTAAFLKKVLNRT